MIARIWRGAVRRSDADRYADYMRGTGIKEYAETAGNRGVLMLRRDESDRSEFVMVTLWESWDAVRAFAGDDVARAVFYPRGRRVPGRARPHRDALRGTGSTRDRRVLI